MPADWSGAAEFHHEPKWPTRRIIIGASCPYRLGRGLTADYLTSNGALQHYPLCVPACYGLVRRFVYSLLPAIAIYSPELLPIRSKCSLMAVVESNKFQILYYVGCPTP